ncbi:hypothetical protein H5T87_08300 [bacterium]|nr:hypothetical protein [bacterium]
MKRIVFFLLYFVLPTFAQPPIYGERGKELSDFWGKSPHYEITDRYERSSFLISTELSPAILIHSNQSKVLLFANMEKWGLSAPTFCALPLRNGIRIIKRGESIPSPSQSAPWLLSWFAGAEGWAEWDAPILIVLQHLPKLVSLSEKGLLLSFSRQVGDIVLMPLYGYYKPPQQGKDYLAQHNLPSKNIRPWQWEKGLPKEVENRCYFLGQVLRAYPLYAEERFAISGDTLIIRESFKWRYIVDDWGTKPIRFAPLPPVLALALWAGNHKYSEKPFPMLFSHPITDPDVFTPYGPWMGITNVDTYEVRFPLLKYVHIMEEPKLPEIDNAPEVVKEALNWVVRRMGEKFQGKDWQEIWDHGGAVNYCWQVMGDRWYAKAIPYLPEDVQERVKRILAEYMRNFVLDEKNYKPFKGMLLLVGPGIGTWGGYDDAGKFSSNLLETLWCYAHFSGDWGIIRGRWETIKRFFITPLECDWKSFGRYAIAEMGDEAAPPLYMARLAYMADDYDTYAFACYIFVRELVHHYVKQVGAEYYRLNQPWHSSEFMPKEVYLTNLWGDLAGWQIDGPTYPKVTGERQFNNRWVRFSSEDVARFYRDILGKEVAEEMELLTKRAKQGITPYTLHEDTAHIAPSIIRLRSLLLNETPEKLYRLSPPSKWNLGRCADGVAFCLSFLRTSHPLSFVRLIPQRNPTKFVLGLERVREYTEFPALCLAIEGKGRKEPYIRWWGWKAPQRADLPNGEWWSFGEIVFGDGIESELDSRYLNWNTFMLYY